MLAGRPGPRYDIAKWRLGKNLEKANSYAKYWLTLLIPWEVQRFENDLAPEICPPAVITGPKFDLDYTRFQIWLSEIQRNSPQNIDRSCPRPSTFISLCHLQLLEFDSQTSVSQSAMQTVATYRGRASKQWSEKEKSIYDQLAAQLGLPSGEEGGRNSILRDLQYLEAETHVDLERENMKRLRQLASRNVLEKMLDYLNTSTRAVISANIQVRAQCSLKQAEQSRIQSKAKRKTLCDENDKDALSRSGPCNLLKSLSSTSSHSVSDTASMVVFDASANVRLEPFEICASLDTTSPVELNELQGRFFTEFMEIIKARGKWIYLYKCWEASPMCAKRPDGPCPQLRRIVLGAPGTGKTVLLRAIDRRLQESNLMVIKVSFTANAAVLCNGSTIHSCFSVNTRRRKKNGENSNPVNVSALPIAELAEKREDFTNAVAVFIDECFQVSADLWGIVEYRMKEIFAFNSPPSCAEQPFCGFSVVAFGDPYQLGPVAGSKNLPSEVIDKLHDRVRKRANNALIENGVQVFQGFDLFLLLQQMRAPDDQLHIDFITRLRSFLFARPVDSKLIIDHIRDLSARDIQDDPTWGKAIIAVLTNRERAIINKHRVLAFGSKVQQPIFEWGLPILDREKSIVAIDDIFKLYAENPELNFLFCKGAVGILSELSKNNTSNRVVKGAPCEFHSILCQNEAEQKEMAQLIDDFVPTSTDDPSANVRHLSFVPKFICVRLTDEETRLNWPRRKEDPHMFVDSLVEDDLVLAFPVTECSDLEVKLNGRMLNFHYYGAELAYGVTFHKLQGRTVDKLIVQLNYNEGMSISLQLLYVALTRVRNSANLRKFPLRDGLSWDHLYDLYPDYDLKEWFACFSEVTGLFNPPSLVELK